MNRLSETLEINRTMVATNRNFDVRILFVLLQAPGTAFLSKKILFEFRLNEIVHCLIVVSELNVRLESLCRYFYKMYQLSKQMLSY